MSSAAKFLLAIVISTGSLAVVMTGLLFANGELYTTTGGARAQFETNGIYGRSIWDDFFAYKFALYEMHPTNVISVGSSRAMPVRALLFQKSDHLTFGGAVNSVAEFEGFAKQIVALGRRPAVVFVYVDFEWFMDSPKRERNRTDRRPYEQWLFVYQSAFVHVRALFESAFADHLKADPETGGALIGSRARRLADGFRIDGSHQQRMSETGRRSPADAALMTISEPESDVANETARRFAAERHWWGATLGENLLRRFETALGVLQSQDISVVLIAAPVAPNVAMTLEQRDELVFFRVWRSRIELISQDRRIPFFDFTQIPLQAPVCYSDLYHASEGAYAWLLSRVRGNLAAEGHRAAGTLDAERLDQFSKSECFRSLGPAIRN